MEPGIYLLKSVTILSIFYVVYYVFLRKDTLFSAKRHYLLGGILASLFLPFVEFTKTIYKDAPVIESIPFTGSIPKTTEAAIQQSTVFSVDWWQVAMVVYGIGVLILVSKLLLQLFSLLKLIRTYPSEKRKKYTFVRVAEVVAPFSFFRYIVYNPELHSEEELEMILKHEQIHVSQWHSIDIIVANLARVLQWVNPFSWLYKRSLEENLEFIADNETIAQLPSKKQYQLTLVKASSPLPTLALTTQFYQSFIKKRIIMLNKSTSKRRNLWKLSIVLPALALFLWSFNVKEVVTYKEVSNESGIPLEVKEHKEPSAIIEEVPESNLTVEPVSEQTTLELVKASEKKDAHFNITKNTSFLDLQNLKQQLKVNGSVEANKRTANYLNKMKELEAILKDFRITITKNTTDAELETMKSELKKDHGIDMKYKVDRNSSGEITSIQISYSDNKGGNGNYSIQDDGAIEEFQFYINEDGKRGFWSEAGEERRLERMKRRAAEMEERNVEREEQMLEREQEMKERRVEMEERRIEMENRSNGSARDAKEMKTSLKEQEKERLVLIKERAKEMQERAKMREKEMILRQKELAERYKEVAKGSSRSKGSTYSYSSSGLGVENAVIIDKDTTDETLDKIKTKLAAKGITFNYSKVKRNSQGEITRIRITTNNGKGSKSTISAQADDGEAINEILIEI